MLIKLQHEILLKKKKKKNYSLFFKILLFMRGANLGVLFRAKTVLIFFITDTLPVRFIHVLRVVRVVQSN